MTTDFAKPTTRPAWAANLSDREWLIVEAYAAELSGVEAALAAGLGHDHKSAREQACRLRKRPRVREAISRVLAERVGRQQGACGRRNQLDSVCGAVRSYLGWPRS